jgi:streptogramin lyase
MNWRKKYFPSLIVFFALLGAAALTFASVHPSRAASALTSVTDYPIASGLDPWGIAFDTAGNVWEAIPGCNPNPDCGNRTSPGKIEVFNPSTSTWTATYQLPSGYGQALFLSFDSSGRVWFPMFHTNALGMYDPASHTFQQWTMPTSASGPWDAVFDHNGKLWITEHYANKVAEFDPTTDTFVKEYSTAASNSEPYGITVDAANNIWFTENNSSVAKIAEITAAGGVQEYPIRNTSSSSLTPHLITVDPNGNIWWTEGFAGMIGELKVASAVPGTNTGITEYAYQHLCNGCSTHTSGISVDSNGFIWFDDSLQNTFGSFSDIGTGTFSMYMAPSSKAHPHDGMRVDSFNRIWFGEQYAEKLAEAVQ